MLALVVLATFIDAGTAIALSGWGAATVATVYVGRSRGKDGLIDIQERQNKALRDEMADNERRCDEKVAELTKNMAVLEGRVQALAEQSGAAIGAAIAPVVADRLVKVVNDVLLRREADVWERPTG